MVSVEIEYIRWAFILLGGFVVGTDDRRQHHDTADRPLQINHLAAPSTLVYQMNCIVYFHQAENVVPK
jgi:hypothetical protein